MYLDQPLQSYLSDLASAQPTPGGGSAAALSGAMAAGLVCMVARLTEGKAEYAEVQSEIATLLQQAEQLRTRFQQLMQEDIDAYRRLSACFKMSRTTNEERATRTRAIQERLIEAAQVPLEIAECAATLTQYCQHIAEIGNTKVLSDVATGTTLATSAGTGASWMVRVNLYSLKDQELVNRLNGRLEKALQTMTTTSQQVVETVEKRMR